MTLPAAPSGQEIFFFCPHCGEEAVAALQPGFNKVACPYCPYYFIVYLDGDGRPWTRVPGVLATSPK